MIMLSVNHLAICDMQCTGHAVGMCDILIGRAELLNQRDDPYPVGIPTGQEKKLNVENQNRLELRFAIQPQQLHVNFKCKEGNAIWLDPHTLVQ